MLFFAQMLGFQTSLLAGGCTLVIMILPTIIRTTQESLKTVPQCYREGALGLGAGKWHMIRTMVLPYSVDGIVTGCILAIGRIVGERPPCCLRRAGAVVLNDFVSAFSLSRLPDRGPVRLCERTRRDRVGFAIAAILMILVLCINGFRQPGRQKLKKRTDRRVKCYGYSHFTDPGPGSLVRRQSGPESVDMDMPEKQVTRFHRAVRLRQVHLLKLKTLDRMNDLVPGWNRAR